VRWRADGIATTDELHDRLKSVLGLPMGIAVGYELEVDGAQDSGNIGDSGAVFVDVVLAARASGRMASVATARFADPAS
jgi:hypothetical protein